MKNVGSKTVVFALVAVLVLVLAGVGVYAMGNKAKPTAAKQPAPAVTGQSTAEATPSSADMTFDNASHPKDPMGARTLGNPGAPVKIEEFASLTCPHCAHFEETTFPTLKKKYIDTGKVFYTYTDFPLNAPALNAAMLARCLPAERYFPFVVLLFNTQAQWAFVSDPDTNLRQTAKLAGLSDKEIDACLANGKLKEGIIKNMQRAQGQGVDSTPSFNINGTIVKGALDIEAFDKAVDEALQKTKSKK